MLYSFVGPFCRVCVLLQYLTLGCEFLAACLMEHSKLGEIELWQWRHTDDFGKRRIFPCRLSVDVCLFFLRSSATMLGCWRRLRSWRRVQDYVHRFEN